MALIKACLNGGRRRDEHPSVPQTAEEIAADAERLIASGLASPCLRILIEIQEHDLAQAAAVAREVDASVEEAAVRTPVLWHGDDVATWAVIEAGLSLGRDVRIGLEDTLRLPDGTVALDNEQLVRLAVKAADERVPRS